jgi:hypothetical protein
MVMNVVDERQSVVAALTSKYPIFPETTIDRLVADEMDKYRTAKVHAFVPVLVQRSVDAHLREANSVGVIEQTPALGQAASPAPLH